MAITTSLSYGDITAVLFQDPQKILIALQYCLSGLPKEDLVRVKKIGVSGQMHGVVFWKRNQGWICNDYGRFVFNVQFKRTSSNMALTLVA